MSEMILEADEILKITPKNNPDGAIMIIQNLDGDIVSRADSNRDANVGEDEV